MTHFTEYKRADLLALPEWQSFRQPSARYESILVLPTGTKHASGWGNLALIGCDSEHIPKELISRSIDDLRFNNKHGLLVRVDCAWPSRAMHYWLPNGYFSVSYALSSTDVYIHPDQRNPK